MNCGHNVTFHPKPHWRTLSGWVLHSLLLVPIFLLVRSMRFTTH